MDWQLELVLIILTTLYVLGNVQYPEVLGSTQRDKRMHTYATVNRELVKHFAFYFAIRSSTAL